MEWINNLINGENSSAVNLILITLALAFLLIVLVWVFKKISGTATRRAMRSRVPRLLITDSATVDEKRFLVMVRRDNVEHLLLIGGANDLVVESNIVRAQTANTPAMANQVPAGKPAEAAAEMIAPETAQPETEKSVTAPVAAVATAGAAGLAGMASSVTAASASAKDTVLDATSNVSESVSDVTTSAGESIVELGSTAKETVLEAASATVETVTDVADAGVNVVSDTADHAKIDSAKDAVSASSSDFVPEPEVISPTIDDTSVETSDVDASLESQISATLDDALSMDDLDLDVTEEAASTEAAGENDDDMKRLLDELSKEMKEPA